MNRTQRFVQYTLALNAIMFLVYSLLDYYFRLRSFGGVPSVEYLIQMVVIGGVMAILTVEYSKEAHADNQLEESLDDLRKSVEELEAKLKRQSGN